VLPMLLKALTFFAASLKPPNWQESTLKCSKIFANFVHNELLIHAASPLSIRQIVCDAAEYEFDYAVAITPDENGFLDRSTLFERIKKNTDKTLTILGQPFYFHSLTV
jgi:hypothetical protein